MDFIFRQKIRILFFGKKSESNYSSKISLHEFIPHYYMNFSTEYEWTAMICWQKAV